MNTNKRKARTSSPLKKNSTLPPMIRRELRMTCAMKALSKLKSGNKKNIKINMNTWLGSFMDVLLAIHHR